MAKEKKPEECPECERDSEYQSPKNLDEVQRMLRKAGYELKKV